MSVKAQVLSALDAARGRYISGQELADQLGVSRAAIWKAVTALRADGTPIEAITNRGYALPPRGRPAERGRHHSAAGPCRCAGGTDHCGGPPARHQCGAAHPGQQRRAGGPCADCPGPVRWARAARAQLLLPAGRAVPEHFAAAGIQHPPVPADHRIGRSCRCPCSGAVVRHAHPDQMGERPVEERKKRSAVF